MEIGGTSKFARTAEGEALPFWFRLCRLRIDTQLVELDPAAGEDQGRMGIVFSPLVPRKDIYFCLECKRLNVREAAAVRPYFAEYVKFGMLRFVRGQYARSVRFGGMLAFVLDESVASAMRGVDRNIRNHHGDLGMAAPGEFRTSSVRPSDTRIRETEHRRGTDPVPFLIQHLFMAGDPTAPLRPATPPVSSAKAKSRAPKRAPNDFAQNLGYPDQPDHPEVAKAMQEITRRIQQARRTTQADVMKSAWISDMLLEAGRRILPA